ncbi:esterase [Longispora fulva]|uniref:Dienelactone hydrolase n=1 Tax=Longispora fulva TaxID=619741 RepID=A0A8J7GDX4_9ACTN|nr:hydrolase [Longispora fulva]MBG6134722.1 dienelactone hydrolase [Longispora fulva]GIG61932.1 esterase [Longispora fulva]
MSGVFAVALASALSLSTALPAMVAPGAAPVQLTLPAPTGHGRIGTVSLHLVDRSRPDPWVPTEPARELMIQLWYPAADTRNRPRAPWVSPGVADRLNPPGSPVTLPVSHAYTGAPAAGGRHPVVVYSPGLGMERTSSTALVEDLASHGYVVVTIDHPHDGRFVEFPGGRIATQALPVPTTPEEEAAMIATALATRVADTRFTLDQLAALDRGHNPDEERRPLPRGLTGALDLDRIGMAGHSLGGATAAQTMLEDRRIRAGVNLDGTVSGTVVTAGLDRPFLLLGSPGDDDSWTALWSRLRGPRHRLELAGSGHMSFTDYQVLLAQAGVPAEDREPSLGTIDGDRSIAVQRAYLLAYFDRYLLCRDGRLLAGPSPRYPEMLFKG